MPVTEANGNITETVAREPVTGGSNGFVTETEASAQPITDTNGDVTDTTLQEEAPKRLGRPGVLRQPIIDLLREHPEGLTALEIRVRLRVDKNIGDTLQGMARDHVIEKQGKGKTVRYLPVAAQDQAPREPSQPKAPARRKAGVR